MKESERESKVLYEDGDKIRALRGRVIDKDTFIEIHRRDGIVQLNKKVVLKIEGG